MHYRMLSLVCFSPWGHIGTIAHWAGLEGESSARAGRLGRISVGVSVSVRETIISGDSFQRNSSLYEEVWASLARAEVLECFICIRTISGCLLDLSF